MTTTAQALIRDMMPLEGELAAVCELLASLGRATETASRWGERWFKFEDGSSIVFGAYLGPYPM